MIRIRWVLSTLFIVTILFYLTPILAGQPLQGALCLAIAAAVICPRLDAVIEKKAAALKAPVLRLALAIVISTIGIAATLTFPLSVESIVLCPTDPIAAESPENTTQSSHDQSIKPCLSDIPFFAAGIQPVTIQISLSQDNIKAIDQLSAKIIARPPNRPSDRPHNDQSADNHLNIIEKTIDLADQTEIAIGLEKLALDVGFYELSVIPNSKQHRQKPTAKTTSFVVLPSQADVLKRLNSTESIRFKDTIHNIIICADPGGDTHCDNHASTLSTKDVVLADTILSAPNANYTWLNNGPAITYALRSVQNDATKIPEILFQNTLDMEENTGTLGIPLGIGNSGLPPGHYDVVMLLDTAQSKPIKAAFTVTE